MHNVRFKDVEKYVPKSSIQNTIYWKGALLNVPVVFFKYVGSKKFWSKFFKQSFIITQCTQIMKMQCNCIKTSMCNTMLLII